MRTRKVVHEGSQLGLTLNEIEGILKENDIKILVRDNKLNIYTKITFRQKISYHLTRF